MIRGVQDLGSERFQRTLIHPLVHFFVKFFVLQRRPSRPAASQFPGLGFGGFGALERGLFKVAQGFHRVLAWSYSGSVGAAGLSLVFLFDKGFWGGG